MDHPTCCQCLPLICGPHIIHACQVSALKQVRSRTDDTVLFVVMIKGSVDATVFLTMEEAAPLLEYWDIDPKLIKPSGRMTPEMREAYQERVRAIKGMRRARNKLVRAGREKK